MSAKLTQAALERCMALIEAGTDPEASEFQTLYRQLGPDLRRIVDAALRMWGVASAPVTRSDVLQGWVDTLRDIQDRLQDQIDQIGLDIADVLELQGAVRQHLGRIVTVRQARGGDEILGVVLENARRDGR